MISQIRPIGPIIKKGVRDDPNAFWENLNFRRSLLLDFHASFYPTGNASRKVLYVFVSEFLGSGSTTFVSLAARPATVRNNEGVFVGRQLGGELFAVFLEVNGTWNAASFVEGLASVYVNHNDLAIFDSGIEIFDADVWVFTCKCRNGKERSDEESQEFFHSIIQFLG